MVDRDPRIQQAKERFKRANEAFDQALAAVLRIEYESPTPDNAEKLKRLKAASDALAELTQIAEKAKAHEDGFNAIVRQLAFQTEVEKLADKGLITDEVKDYFFGYITYAQLKAEKKLSGLFGKFFEDAEKKMEGAATASTWPELAPEFANVQAEIKGLKDAGRKPHTIPDLEKKDNPLEPLIDTGVDWKLLSTDDPAIGTPIQAIEKFADFQNKVKYAAKLVDGGQPLRAEQTKLLEEKIDRLNDDAVVFRAHPTVEQAVRNLQALLQEILNRSVTRNVEKQAAHDEDLKGYLRPTVKEVMVNGEDEVRVFLEYLGEDDIAEAERIALKIAHAEDPKKAITSEELTKLLRIEEKIKRQAGKYVAYFLTSQDVIDPAAWALSSDLNTEIGVYQDWLQTLIRLAGGSVSGADIKPPELQAAQELWYAFFEKVVKQPNALETMKEWGDTIMTSFYPASEPRESHKSQLQTQRFSAWRDALKKKHKETKELKYKLLWMKYENTRLITDAMITFSQSRGMTSDWHSDEMLTKLQTESQALHGFKPEAIDFFTIPTDRAREITKKAHKKKKRLDEDVNEIDHYPFAANVNATVDEFKRLLRTPGSGFYRKEWNDDDLSRDAIKAQLKEYWKKKYTGAPGEPTAEDIEDIVEIAYTIASFAGLRLDTFGESYEAGDSPAGSTIPPRQDYYKEGCPPMGYFYGAYEKPKYIPEMEYIYKPDELITDWKVRYVMMAETPKSGEEFYSRINSIEQSIYGTQLTLEAEFAPLRIEDKKMPFGYALERYDYDGMQKWQYPSMYRFLFDPQFQEMRRMNGQTFFEQVEGFKAFKEYRKLAHADLDVTEKSPEAAIKHLMENLDLLVSGISKLKANYMVDWNYIGVLMVGFVDRMYRAYAFCKGSEEEKDAKRSFLKDQIEQVFGATPTSVWIAGKLHKLVASEHAPEMLDNVSNNKLNTAGEFDLFRALPPGMPIEQKRKLYAIKIDAEKKRARAEGKSQEEIDAIGDKKLMVPFARAILEQLWLESTENNQRRHMLYHLSEAFDGMPIVESLLEFAEHAELKTFNARYPSFHRTFKPFGLSTEKQKTTASGAKE